MGENRATVKGESRREDGEKQRERMTDEGGGGGRVSRCGTHNVRAGVSKQEQRGRRNRRGGVSGECHRPLTCHTRRCLGRQGGGLEDWGQNRGAGRRSKRPPLREETKMQKEDGWIDQGTKVENPGDRWGGSQRCTNIHIFLNVLLIKIHSSNILSLFLPPCFSSRHA